MVYSYFLVTLISYLLGSIPGAILVCKVLSLPDPRTVGSKNPGATNVMRIGGKKVAIMTFFFDMIKGVLPIVFVKYFFNLDSNDDLYIIISLVAFFVFIGHLYPIFFAFKGGKGVATLVGILIGINFPMAIVFGVSWFFIFKFTRLVAFASIMSLLPVIIINCLLFNKKEYIILFVVLFFLILYRHKRNIKDMLKGKEYKFDK